MRFGVVLLVFDFKDGGLVLGATFSGAPVSVSTIGAGTTVLLRSGCSTTVLVADCLNILM
jgi:hypothetical protein